MTRLSKWILSISALGLALGGGFAGGTASAADGAAVQVKEFRYLDKELDRISLDTASKPDGTRDGHLSLQIDAGAGTEIKSITMKTADKDGNDVNHGIWKTYKEKEGDNGYLLVVVKDGKIVNSTFQATLGQFEGIHQLELYASDNNGMKPGEYYYLEIVTASGTVKSPVTPFVDAESSYAPVTIREFSSVDLKSDLTGSAFFEPDKREDGHFKLKLTFAQQTEVLAVILRPTDKDGKDAYKGIWRTNRAGVGWLLGIKQGDTVITPEFKKDAQEPVGKFRGTVAWDLYANNNGDIKNGQYYVVEVETKFGTIVSKPIEFGNPASNFVDDTPIGFKTIMLTLQSTKAFVNDEPMELQVAPFTYEGRTVVPIRFVAEALGAKVDWNKTTRKVMLEKDGTKIEIVIDQKEAVVDGQKVALDAPAIVRNDVTLLPIRFVSESLKMKVFFDDGEIVITDAQEQA